MKISLEKSTKIESSRYKILLSSLIPVVYVYVQTKGKRVNIAYDLLNCFRVIEMGSSE